MAERLLDLHCRLISLYVLQDADCLHWEEQQPFFESERGSFVIQMWWLYMQGNLDQEIKLIFVSEFKVEYLYHKLSGDIIRKTRQ